AADVWSLGALVFELISGQKPFGAGYKAVPAIMAALVAPVPSVIESNPQFRPAGKDVYELVKQCLEANPAERPTADELVSKCEELCYPDATREFGQVRKFDNQHWGFIASDGGDDVFFHVESVFGAEKVKKGDRVWFARHKGGGADRAFPVLKV